MREKIRKFLKWSVFLIFLILNWTALDDITTGSEPGLWGEWTIVIVSGTAVLLAALYYLIRKLGK